LLKYSTEFSLNPSAGGVARQVFVANGLYDPDYSGVGHQPYSFDQIMALYNHYTVLKARITVRQVAAGGDVYGAFGVTLSGSADDLSGLSLDTILEHPGTKSWAEIVRYTQPAPQEVSFDAQQFFGATNVVGKDPYVGTAAANPSEQAFFTVWIGAHAGTDPSAVTFQATLEFEAVFSEPRTLSSS
jgi:hypothetical protein